MNKIYKVVWEAVLPIGPGSQYYTGDRPNRKPSEVPDEVWLETENIGPTGSARLQYEKLKEWAEGGIELIRKVRLYQRDDDWELLDPQAKQEGDSE